MSSIRRGASKLILASSGGVRDFPGRIFSSRAIAFSSSSINSPGSRGGTPRSRGANAGSSNGWVKEVGTAQFFPRAQCDDRVQAGYTSAIPILQGATRFRWHFCGDRRIFGYTCLSPSGIRDNLIALFESGVTPERVEIPAPNGCEQGVRVRGDGSINIRGSSRAGWASIRQRPLPDTTHHDGADGTRARGEKPPLRLRSMRTPLAAPFQCRRWRWDAFDRDVINAGSGRSVRGQTRS